MLKRRPDLPREQVQKFVTEILDSTTRMNRAVDLLVDVAALEAGRIAPVSRQVNVKAFAEERLKQWRGRYPQRATDLRRRVAASLPAMDADPLWLSKALDELVDNAVKYTPRGAAITLAATKADGGGVTISVRDAGPGIDTDRLGELLGDFSQADASQTRHVGGFGLGLGFVSRVASQLGMRLHVESAPGRGAHFGLDVPAFRAASTSRRAAAKPTAKRAGKSGRSRR
jgi:signal transduction histidine kinase